MVCTICEQERVGVDGWFMLAENEWLDRLKVLAWNDTLAVREDVHCLCCVAHVQELVAHWMATDSLAAVVHDGAAVTHRGDTEKSVKIIDPA